MQNLIPRFNRNQATLLLALLVLSFQAVSAQPGTYQVEYQLVKAASQPAKMLLESEQWLKDLSSNKMQLLESGGVAAIFGEDSYSQSGIKVPIPYRDPRVDGYQVQYIDEGFKIDCSASPYENGLIKVVTRVTKATLAPDAISAYGQDTFLCDSTVLMRRGQTAILTTTRGMVTGEYLNKMYPGTTFGENDTVLLAITLR